MPRDNQWTTNDDHADRADKIASVTIRLDCTRFFFLQNYILVIWGSMIAFTPLWYLCRSAPWHCWMISVLHLELRARGACCKKRTVYLQSFALRVISAGPSDYSFSSEVHTTIKVSLESAGGESWAAALFRCRQVCCLIGLPNIPDRQQGISAIHKRFCASYRMYTPIGGLYCASSRGLWIVRSVVVYNGAYT